jgi:hypothetical protein
MRMLFPLSACLRMPRYRAFDEHAHKLPVPAELAPPIAVKYTTRVDARRLGLA